MNNQKALFYAFLAIATTIMAASLFYILSVLQDEQQLQRVESQENIIWLAAEFERAGIEFLAQLGQYQSGQISKDQVVTSLNRFTQRAALINQKELRELYSSTGSGDRTLNDVLEVLSALKQPLEKLDVGDSEAVEKFATPIRDVLKQHRAVELEAVAIDQRKKTERQARFNVLFTNAVALLFGLVITGGLLATALFAQQRVLSSLSKTLGSRVEKRTAQLKKANRKLELEIVERERTQKDLHDFNLTLEERVRERTIELEQANQAKSEFLSRMSHELRTPLNAIIGLSEMLLEDIQDEVYDDPGESLTRVNKAGQHLLHLINEILDLSKIEAGKMELIYEKIRLKKFTTDVYLTSKPLAENNNNVIELIYSNDVDWIYTDPVRLRQVLFNLLSNASKFTQNGRIEFRIEFSDLDKKVIGFSVSDSGIGIEDQQKESIFQEFQQVEIGSRRSYEGTGLGLAISRNLCSLLGGKLDVVSELGVGSVFTVHMPQQGNEADDRLV